jgi:ppGpp synthetase/RelA/SpoT-type nucleotidyltranferase
MPHCSQVNIVVFSQILVISLLEQFRNRGGAMRINVEGVFAKQHRFSSKTMKSITADKLPNMHSTEFRGIPVVIQWPKGSTRVGERKDGTPFKTEMRADYGYIPDTVASGDEERLDVYIGPDKNAEFAYAIEQVRRDTKEFDEYKIMLGFSSLEEAEEMYNAHVGDANSDVEMEDISEIPFDYLFDHVTAERKEDEEQEREETHTRIKEDESKIAEHSEQMTVIDAFVKNYKHTFDFYEEVSKHASQELEAALQEAGIRAIVTHRAKRPRKLRTKLIERDQKRHYQSFRDIYEDIVDLAGVRVALYLPADRPAVGEIIEKVFAPMRAPKVFPRDRGPSDGGYVATHYLVQLRPETLHKDELRYADTNIEIQVASVLMHAWAEVTHDLTYKPAKGPLTAEEMKLVNDLNTIVQAGEATLEKLQRSVESRNQGAELRFELAAALTKLGERLAVQSKGKAKTRIAPYDVFHVAKQAAISSKIETGIPSIHDTYVRAKLALWKAHKADELDDKLKSFWQQKKIERPVGQDDPYIAEAKQMLGFAPDQKLTTAEASQLMQTAQQLKTNPKP